jgi:hypothetical protein
MPGFVFLAPGANGLKVLPLHVFDYETSESDPINRSSIHPAKVHPTNIVKLALNRFINAVFMMFSPPCAFYYWSCKLFSEYRMYYANDVPMFGEIWK